LEFIIKSYPIGQNPKHSGMMEHLGRDIEVGDSLLFGDAWGAIAYRGPGVFIAGGAGITPFIAILRQQEQEGKLAGNQLFISNQKADEVILEDELTRLLGADAVFTLTQEQHRDYEHGRINRNWLESRIDHFDQPFYLCGPPEMVKEFTKVLNAIGATIDSLVFEK